LANLLLFTRRILHHRIWPSFYHVILNSQPSISSCVYTNRQFHSRPSPPVVPRTRTQARRRAPSRSPPCASSRRRSASFSRDFDPLRYLRFPQVARPLGGVGASCLRCKHWPRRRARANQPRHPPASSLRPPHRPRLPLPWPSFGPRFLPQDRATQCAASTSAGAATRTIAFRHLVLAV